MSANNVEGKESSKLFPWLDQTELFLCDIFMPSSIWQKKKQMTGQLENVKKSIFLGLRRVFF